jgi:hypothetical protein
MIGGPCRQTIGHTWESLEVYVHHLHGVLWQFHPGLRGRRDQCHDRTLALPGSRRGTSDHRIIESSRALFPWSSRIRQ